MAQESDLNEDNIQTEENLDVEFKEDKNELSLEEETQTSNLITHEKIKSTLCGTVIEHKKGFAKTTLHTTDEMAVDDLGLVHSGFIYGGADYAAVAAVNEKNIVIIGDKSKFFAPAKVNDLIIYEAKAKFEDSRKREIRVTGKINDIKVYEGLFHAVVLENHIFKTKIKNIDRKY